MTEINYKITDKLTQKIIEEILYIKDTYGLTAESIIKRAENENSPLHDFFTWEDSIAAHQWRLQEARILVNEVKIIIEDKEYAAFENVSVSHNEGTLKSKQYMSTLEIIDNEELRKQVIRRSLEALKHWELKNQSYTELRPIIKASQETRERLYKKWQKKKQ